MSVAAEEHDGSPEKAALTTRRREAYANDQGQPASLVAVTARTNRSKSDQDPAEWLPPTPGALYRYGAEWTATKLRWNLTIDKQEKTALLDIASSCDSTTVTYTPAPEASSSPGPRGHAARATPWVRARRRSSERAAGREGAVAQ